MFPIVRLHIDMLKSQVILFVEAVGAVDCNHNLVLKFVASVMENDLEYVHIVMEVVKKIKA